MLFNTPASTRFFRHSRKARPVNSPLNQLADSSCGGGPGSVPVFNCIVILTRDPQTGKIHGKVANLAGISGEATSERDLLFLLTRRFRELLQTCSRENRPIRWLDPPETPGPGEQQRFIPIHL
ncbi:MAG: hypothetical protein RLZZ536_2690 [Planctomycetota bacterium]